MANSAKPKKRLRIVLAIGLGIAVFLIVYLGWAYHTSSQRFNYAERLAEGRAHTIIGKEGYEYIFEPWTQTLLDKIMPNRQVIIFYILAKDYLPGLNKTGCMLADQDICKWVDILVFYYHDPTPAIRQMLAYATIISLLTAGGVYLLSNRHTG